MGVRREERGERERYPTKRGERRVGPTVPRQHLTCTCPINNQPNGYVTTGTKVSYGNKCPGLFRSKKKCLKCAIFGKIRGGGGLHLFPSWLLTLLKSNQINDPTPLCQLNCHSLSSHLTCSFSQINVNHGVEQTFFQPVLEL